VVVATPQHGESLVTEWVGEGRTVEKAVARGLAVLKLNRDSVDVKVLKERKSGLLSMLGYRSVKVRVVQRVKVSSFVERRHDEEARDRWERNEQGRYENRRISKEDRGGPAVRPSRTVQKLKPVPLPKRFAKQILKQPVVRSKTKTPPEKPLLLPKKTAEKFKVRPGADLGTKHTVHPPVPVGALLEQWRDLLGWEDLSWSFVPGEGKNTAVKLKTSRGSLLAGGDGRVLEAFEYLFNLVSSGGNREIPWVGFQVEGFRSTAESGLAEKARFAAFQVRRTGTPFAMDPMSAAHRRIVHQTLVSHPDVITSSSGEGPLRHVVVCLKNASVSPTENTDDAPKNPR